MLPLIELPLTSIIQNLHLNDLSIINTAIDEALAIPVEKLSQQGNDLNELEKAVSQVYKNYCSKGVLSWVKSFFVITLEMKCESLSKRIQSAFDGGIQDLLELHPMLQEVNLKSGASNKEFAFLQDCKYLLDQVWGESEQIEVINKIKQIPVDQRVEQVHSTVERGGY